MDEKTASMLRMDNKGRKGPRRCSPCLKFGMWFTACSALMMIALVMISTLWTLLAYHRTVTALQDRLDKLETEVESSKHNIDQIVEEKIKYILKERFQTVTVEEDTVRRKDPKRVVRQACSCPPGPEGPKGNMGVQGDVGFPGPIGLKGQLGLPGPKGGKGDMGDTGHEGQKGDGGLPGYDGIVGQKSGQKRSLRLDNDRDTYEVVQLQKPDVEVITIKGERGPQGLSGGIGPEWVEKVVTLKGEPGEPGRLGPPGPAGPIGKPGLPGFDGLPGDLGPHGPAGPAGPQGPAGRDGRPGDPGDPGLPGLPIVGRNSHVSSTNTEIGPVNINENYPAGFLMGPPGPRGPRGKMGPPGPPGPLTSALDGSCQCSKGDKGDRGRDGRRGKRGRKGDKGDRGIPGLDAPCPLGKDGLPLPGCYYEMPDKGEPILDSQLCPVGPNGRRDCSIRGNKGAIRNP